MGQETIQRRINWKTNSGKYFYDYFSFWSFKIGVSAYVVPSQLTSKQTYLQSNLSLNQVTCAFPAGVSASHCESNWSLLIILTTIEDLELIYRVPTYTTKVN